MSALAARRTHTDVLFGLLLAVWGQLELWWSGFVFTVDPNRRPMWLLTLCQLGMTAPVAIRRRVPLTALSIALGALAVEQLATAPADTGAASLMAIPLGILGGIYLSEYGGRRPLARFIRFLSEVMTGVPSIVMGLFIYTLVVLNTKERTGFAGALALACLMLPIVIRTTDQMLSLVPAELREGSYALGSRRVRTIRTVVLPNAAAGIVSGALIAVARAAGETAPLLFTIGVVTETNTDLFKGENTALSVQIFNNATSPFPPAQDRAGGAALPLIVIVFVFTIPARLVPAFFARRQTA